MTETRRKEGCVHRLCRELLQPWDKLSPCFLFPLESCCAGPGRDIYNRIQGGTAPPPQKGNRQKCSSRKKGWTAQEDEEIIRIKLKNQKETSIYTDVIMSTWKSLKALHVENFPFLELVFYFIWNYILFLCNFVRTLVYIPVFLVRI